MVQKLFQSSSKWLEQQQTSILSAATIITISVMLSSITGLLSYRFLASRFYNPSTKTQFELDAYWVAFQPSDLVFQLLVVGALSAAFIPVFTKHKHINEKDAFDMASSAINVLLCVFVVFGAVVFVFADQIVRVMTGAQFSDVQVQMAANMTRMMLFAQFFFAISNFLSGMIQSYQRFIIPAISPIVYNLGIIFGTLFLSKFVGIYGAVWGVLIGAFLHMALQVPLAWKLGFRYSFKVHLKHPGLREIITLTIPRTVSVGMDLLQPYFLTFFITTIGGASLTIMKFAQKLMSIPIRMFGVPIGQAALPFLSKETNEHDFVRFNQLFVQSLNQIMFFALPASVLLLILRIPIVRFAFGAKNFPWSDTVLTGRVVAILAISVAAQAATHILIRGFYALHDTRKPFFVSLFSVIINVGLGWYVSFFTNFGILGLATTIAISAFSETIILFVLLYFRVKFSLFVVLKSQMKMIFAAVLMALALYFPMKLLDQTVIDTTRTLGLFALTSVVSISGMITYIFFCFILKVEELYILKKLYGKMNKWKQNLAKSSESIETVSVGSQTSSE